MDPGNNLGIPFLTRKMLNFEHGVVFGLRVRSVGQSSAVLTIRGLTREGVFTYSHAVSGDGSITSEDFALPDIPTLISILDTAEVLFQGTVYASVALIANGDVVQELCGGLVYKHRGISWPESNVEDIRPGGSRITQASIATPSAGAEIVQAVATNQQWIIQSIRFTLTTDANAADRRVHIQIGTDTTVDIDAFSQTDHTASLARNYTCAHFGAINDSVDDDDILIPIPANIEISDIWRITTDTTNLQAGDAFTAGKILVKNFFK